MLLTILVGGSENAFAHMGWFFSKAALITLGAIIGLFYFKRSVLQVIGVCALVGLVMKMSGVLL